MASKSLSVPAGSKLPTRILADRVVAKLVEAEKALQFATTVHQAKVVADVAAAQQLFAARQGLSKEIQAHGYRIEIYALAKLGELIAEAQRSGEIASRGRPFKSSVAEDLLSIGVTHKVSAVAKQLASLPAPTRDAIASQEMKLSDVIREKKRQDVKEHLESVEVVEAKAISGVYDVVVIDPPWQMSKIERDVTPEQVEFEYPTMSEAELTALQIPAADTAHVWLWTTHKFLPMAFRLLAAWDLSYVCTFVWHKPGGFQPFDLPQYNCEFALYARRGAPKFMDTKDFPVCFNAKRGAHSEKPEEFYEMVRRVTAGRRIDMFNRRKIDGFDTWGKEAA